MGHTKIVKDTNYILFHMMSKLLSASGLSSLLYLENSCRKLCLMTSLLV